MAMVVQLCEYTKKQGNGHFEWMHYMTCEWYLNRGFGNKGISRKLPYLKNVPQ